MSKEEKEIKDTAVGQDNEPTPTAQTTQTADSETPETVSGKAAEKSDAEVPEENEKTDKKAQKSPRAKKKINIRSLKHGTMSIILTVVFIAAVVLANVIVGIISERVDTTADLSDAGIYSLEEDTEKYLSEQLDSDVSITVLNPEADFEAQGTHYKQINELLRKMEMASGHVSIQYLDADQNPNYTAQFKGENLSANYIVIESEKTGRHRIVTPMDYFTFDETYMQYYGQYVANGSNIEQAAVSAMMYVTNDDPVRVAFTEGFGEKDSSALQKLLSDNGYEVETLNLSTTDEIDAAIDFVVMFAPTMDVDNQHLTKLDKYLDNGGAFGKNLMYFASVSQPKTPNIDAFLKDWGIEVGFSEIGMSDENYLISNFTLYAHLQRICDTEYAGDTYASSLYTFGANIRPVIQLWDEGARGNIEQDILMQTHDKAFLVPLEGIDDSFSLDTAESGIFNDAVMAYKIQSDTQALSRVGVFGSEQLAGSSFMSMSNANNGEFFINTFNYISGKEDTITIKSKSYSSATFDMSAQTANVLAVVLCVVIPIIVIVLGIVIWVRRRHR